MKVISLGGGVQSSAMLLMALDGEFGEKPELAVFADPGWETQATYDWIERLKIEVAPFPIVTVSNGNIRTNCSPRKNKDGSSFVTLPTFTAEGGMGRRQCTSEFKLKPIYRYFRKVLGATRRNPAECWIGISTDEAIRMKPSLVKYVVNKWPLLDFRLSREDCSNYLRERFGVVAPKSSCIGCPYHSDKYWAQLRAESPVEFADACQFDDELRADPRLRKAEFLHRSMKPLRQIKEFLHENQTGMFFDAFGNECEGMCGV